MKTLFLIAVGVGLVLVVCVACALRWFYRCVFGKEDSGEAEALAFDYAGQEPVEVYEEWGMPITIDVESREKKEQ